MSNEQNKKSGIQNEYGIKDLRKYSKTNIYHKLIWELKKMGLKAKEIVEITEVNENSLRGITYKMPKDQEHFGLFELTNVLYSYISIIYSSYVDKNKGTQKLDNYVLDAIMKLQDHLDVASFRPMDDPDQEEEDEDSISENTDEDESEDKDDDDSTKILDPDIKIAEDAVTDLPIEEENRETPPDIIEDILEEIHEDENKSESVEEELTTTTTTKKGKKKGRKRKRGKKKTKTPKEPETPVIEQ
jgi:hypothetical protein